jgi:hypothetical protein
MHTTGEEKELEAITRGSNAAPVKKVIMSADGDVGVGPKVPDRIVAVRVAVSEGKEATEYGWMDLPGYTNQGSYCVCTRMLRVEDRIILP